MRFISARSSSYGVILERFERTMSSDQKKKKSCMTAMAFSNSRDNCFREKDQNLGVFARIPIALYTRIAIKIAKRARAGINLIRFVLVNNGFLRAKVHDPPSFSTLLGQVSAPSLA